MFCKWIPNLSRYSWSTAKNISQKETQVYGSYWIRARFVKYTEIKYWSTNIQYYWLTL